MSGWQRIGVVVLVAWLTAVPICIAVGNNNARLLWLALIVPLALLWLLGAAVIGAVRWVARGFRRT
jgi:hypothetical protein